jgi:putative adenylate-forming enzyme
MNRLLTAWVAVTGFIGASWRFRRLHGDKLREWQEKHAQIAAAYALTHSAFWKERAHGLDASQWRSFPVVDKATVMAHFDVFNTRGVRAADVMMHARHEQQGPHTTLQGLTVGLSSGTSGHHTISLLDASEQAGFAGFMVSRLLDGVPKLRRRRVAFFMRANSKAYEAANSPIIDYRFFDLSWSEEKIAQDLNDLQPDVVLGPPAMLGIIANLVSTGRAPIQPELVFSVAEVLEPQQRLHLEHVFGVMVRNVYHTSEGLLGVTCRAGRLHIPEDVTHVDLEPLGEGRFTPVMTQLFRRVLPFMRYRMNDVITLDETPCPCGSSFRVIAHIEGRCDDIFLLKSVQGTVRRVFPDHIRRAILAFDGVREYRADQRSFTHIDVALEVSKPIDVDALVGRLCQELHPDDCVPPTIAVTLHIRHENDRKRKLVRVRRHFSAGSEFFDHDGHTEASV